MMKNLGIVLVLTLSLISCTKKSSDATKVVPVLSHEQRPVIKPEESAFQIYRVLSKDPKNVNFSPLSLNMAFSLIYPGANENTKETLEQIFGFKSSSTHPFADEFALVEQFEKEKGGTNTLLIANSIWAKEPKQILPSFREALHPMDAELHSLNLKEMNAWVKESTQGKIDKIMETLDPKMLMVVVNALYFKAKWATPFTKEATILGHFQSSPYGSSTTLMMHQTSRFRYFEDELSQWIELPYQNSPFVMLLALPKKRFELSKIEEKLTSDYLRNVEAKLNTEKVELILPKFKINQKESLTQVMSMAGFSSLFTKGAFGKISRSGEFKISDVIQATAMEVNEQGTEAAAATAIALEKSSMDVGFPKKFYADQPFLFILKNKKSGALYFLGRVYQP